MTWLTDNIGAIALGIGLILGLALLTRGNLKGTKTSPVKGCDNCTCQGGGCHRQGEAS
ncbi:MAG: hypothetical protein GXY84_08120 [Clostridiales bacterium]|nr:hypothetical protein [Clostridiales bacterium]